MKRGRSREGEGRSCEEREEPGGEGRSREEREELVKKEKRIPQVPREGWPLANSLTIAPTRALMFMMTHSFKYVSLNALGWEEEKNAWARTKLMPCRWP